MRRDVALFLVKEMIKQRANRVGECSEYGPGLDPDSLGSLDPEIKPKEAWNGPQRTK
jgi:hypothetical protein